MYSWVANTLNGREKKKSDKHKRCDRRRETDVKQLMMNLPQLLWWLFVWSGMILSIRWTRVKWIKTFPPDNGKNNNREQQGSLTVLPTGWIVFTHVILMSLWWVTMYAHARGFPHWRYLYTSTSEPPSKPRKPPDISPTTRVTTANMTQRLLVLGLQAAAIVARETPTIQLSSNHKQRSQIRKMAHHRRDDIIVGTMMMMKGTTERMDELWHALHQVSHQQELLTNDSSFDVIFDTGCTQSGTGFMEDFVPGTLKDLPHPLHMAGVAGGVEVTQRGIMKFEVVTDSGEIRSIESPAFLIPGFKCRLFSPQGYMRQMNDTNAKFIVRSTHSIFSWGSRNKQTTITIPYDVNTHLPTVRAYHNALNTAKLLALKGCVTEEINQNLTNAQKLLLRVHFKLGHLGFTTVQWLGRQGWLGTLGAKMGRSTLQIPKCAACQFGKQHRTPVPTQHIRHDPTGHLSKGKLEPGELIFQRPI